ncbi:PITPNC1 [Branchiostoma lanceolatum]|uniref:Cytoplasmic phosphatidylinositol transfer protein 1 n=1 Tax=Branchiostoma lanceolatum TaxID=7740 RepID=A0A8K0AE30_BRALA|nr:PITPNC1 [Branchiostoma lanceolatum]
MLMKEYRICMPLTVEEYRIGQLYMIAKHSQEQSMKGEGVEVVRNEPCEDEEHGRGRYTEKRIHLSSRLPSWIRAVVPRIFYITERAWNFYPHTITEYTCSFLPKFIILIETKYQNNNGSSCNCLGLTDEELTQREVDFIDIATDDIPDKQYQASEDCTKFKSKKTNRGPLAEGWRDTHDPIMCSYKLVTVKFEVWGLQTRVEAFAHRAIRDILLVGHRQAFTWVDEWFGMAMDDVRDFEQRLQEETNQRVLATPSSENLSMTTASPGSTPEPSPLGPSPPMDFPRRKSSAGCGTQADAPSTSKQSDPQ